MNETRRWWKLSWPAIVVGLAMLCALTVKNLDGTHWRAIEREAYYSTTSGPSGAWSAVHWTSMLPGSSGEYDRYYEIGGGWEFGWPWRCHRHGYMLPDSSGVKYSVVAPRWPCSETKLVSLSLLLLNIAVNAIVVLGSISVVNRWVVAGDLRCKISLRFVLATTAFIGTNTMLVMRSHDWLWTVKPMATGVLCFGIFLSCCAVIDWIGWGCSMAARRKVA